MALETCLKRIEGARGLPAFGQVIAELRSTLVNQNASIRQLTSVILRDVGLTARLLRMVNSAHVNHSGAPIASIAHAVVMLGWNTIAGMAAGVLLFENMKDGSATVKELTMLSLLTANHARAVATRVGHPRVEEAYLAGLFHGLGELLLAAHLPTQHHAVMALAREQGMRPSDACRKVLQFSFEELGDAMARRWNLPERIRNTMRPLGKTPADMERDVLHALAAFSHDLSATTYRDAVGVANKTQDELLREYENPLKLDGKDVDEVLRVGATETKEDLAAAGVPVLSARVNRRLAEVLKSMPQKPGEAVREAAPAAPPSMANLVDEVSAVLESGEQFNVNDVINMVLEVLLRGGGFERALFCVVSPDQTGVEGRMALGAEAEELTARFRFPLTLLSGPLVPVLKNGQAVFVDDVAASRYARSSFSTALGASGAFGMFPLRVEGVVVGGFYVDRAQGPLSPDEAWRPHLLGVVELCGKYLAAQRAWLAAPAGA